MLSLHLKKVWKYIFLIGEDILITENKLSLLRGFISIKINFNDFLYIMDNNNSTWVMHEQDFQTFSQ